jgi:membrane protease YdiL (CAAX protease family)
MLVALVSFQGSLIAFVPGFLREHEAGPIEAFGLNKRLTVALASGLFAACMFYMAGGLIQAATAWLMQHFPVTPIKPEEQTAVHTLRLASSWFERLTLGAGAIILAPLAEEVLFRGILYPWIKSLGYPQLALWGTSLLFAMVHFNLLSLPALFVLALILTLLYEVTGNLLAPITAHIFFNALNLLQLYSIERHIQQQPY